MALLRIKRLPDGKGRRTIAYPFLRLFLFFAAATLGLFSTSFSYAATITIQRTISFGDITAHPSGDRITIDASSGENTPVSRTGFSVLTGGISGKINFDSNDVGKPVMVSYPAQVVLRCLADGTKTMIIDDLDVNSTQAFIIQVPVQEIHVGGQLNISSGQHPCAYSGDLTITIVY